MFLLKAQNLEIELKGKKILKNITFEIQENEKVALIGENGIGKTTLIKGLLGTIPLTKGKVYWGIPQKDIGVMDQDFSIDSSISTKEWMEHGHINHQIKHQLNKLIKKLETQSDEKTISKYNEFLQQYIDRGGYEWEANIEKKLKQIGITEEFWDVPLANLSGGQKTKVKLAKLMLESPKLLILDEPTNHLDVETVIWLQQWLKDFKGGVFFISHDREFIDQVANKTFELSKDGLKIYKGGYRNYKVQKELEWKTLHANYEKYEKERKKLMETIAHYKQWYEKANAAASVRDPYAQRKAAKQATKYKAKEKALERLENNRVEKPEEQKTISLNLTTNDFSGKKMIDIHHLNFSYGHQQIFKNVNLQLNRGERLAVIGPNGSGKTTLLKLIAGELSPQSGYILRHPQLKIGYFFQELEQLNPENTILDEILSVQNMTQSEARTILACFLFRRDDVYKKINELSMGEKCRVAFVKLYFSNANLLILDEPTNYFDIPTREIVEDTLEKYNGSIVIVAHDPYLLRKVSNKVLKLENGKATVFQGSYGEWEQHKYLTPPTQELSNELEKLELQYLQYMMEESSDEETEMERLDLLKKLKKRINDLKEKLKSEEISD